MKRNELWLGGLLAVAGFFGACTNVVEDESQNNKYPMELMAEKSAITFAYFGISLGSERNGLCGYPSVAGGWFVE